MASAEKTVSFRADAEKIDTLDSLAAAQDRPRSYLINEAITNYIELHVYQDKVVRSGIQQMREGRLTSHEEVMRRIKKTARASK
jgi:predicted transcriptional regulator